MRKGHRMLRSGNDIVNLFLGGFLKIRPHVINSDMVRCSHHYRQNEIGDNNTSTHLFITNKEGKARKSSCNHKREILVRMVEIRLPRGDLDYF